MLPVNHARAGSPRDRVPSRQGPALQQSLQLLKTELAAEERLNIWESRPANDSLATHIAIGIDCPRRQSSSGLVQLSPRAGPIRTGHGLSVRAPECTEHRANPVCMTTETGLATHGLGTTKGFTSVGYALASVPALTMPPTLTRQNLSNNLAHPAPVVAHSQTRVTLPQWLRTARLGSYPALSVLVMPSRNIYLPSEPTSRVWNVVGLREAKPPPKTFEMTFLCINIRGKGGMPNAEEPGFCFRSLYSSKREAAGDGKPSEGKEI